MNWLVPVIVGGVILLLSIWAGKIEVWLCSLIICVLFCIFRCFCCCFVPYYRIEPSSAPFRLKVLSIIIGFLFDVFPISFMHKISQKRDPQSEGNVNVETIIVNAKKGYKMQMNIYTSKEKIEHTEESHLIESRTEEEEEENDGVATPSKLFLYFHAGGFVIGGANDTDRQCKEILKTFPDSLVLSANYRKSPQHNMEDIFEDSIFSFSYLVNQYAPNQDLEIIVIGESAGGHLAAVLASKLRDLSYSLYPKDKLHFVLIYPHLTDYIADAELVLSQNLESRKLFRYGLIVNEAFDLVVGKHLKWGDEALAYSVFEDLKNLPSFFVLTADYDFCKSDGLHFVQELQKQEDVNVVDYMNIEDEVHAFMTESAIHKENWKYVIDRICQNIESRFS